MSERKIRGEKQVKISGTIRQDQDRWIAEKIREGKYYNKSHVLQEGIKALQEREGI
jgi:Arc/MetJ-type ribon-helix-helix transcriptional regulator